MTLSIPQREVGPMEALACLTSWVMTPMPSMVATILSPAKDLVGADGARHSGARGAPGGDDVAGLEEDRRSVLDELVNVMDHVRAVRILHQLSVDGERLLRSSVLDEPPELRRTHGARCRGPSYEPIRALLLLAPAASIRHVELDGVAEDVFLAFARSHTSPARR
jgi:hypothetical protein